MATTRKPRIVIRNSKVHGRGVYAARAIKSGERIVEYRGERISWREADRRPPSDPDDPNHTFFFSLSDGKTVIDASVGGNMARFINHACDPNCESEESDDGRVFIEAVRDIKAGAELNYDYGLVVDERLTPRLKKEHECRCGSPKCRGTMLALKPRRKKAAKKAAKKVAKKAEKKAAKQIGKPTGKPTSTKAAKKSTRTPAAKGTR